MDRLIHTALTGLQRAAEAQAVNAHNLANSQTPGFRREMVALSAGWLVADGVALSARVQSGGESPHDLLRPGRQELTGNPLDIALEGDAWLAVADETGGEALTRRGDLRIDGSGRLLTGDGRPVLGEDGPILIAAGFATARIDRSGVVQVRAGTDAPFVTVARLRLVTPDPAELARGTDGLFRAPGTAPDPDAGVVPGTLERSNAEPVAALVEMIELSRRFELQTRLLTTARELDAGTSALMRMETS